MLGQQKASKRMLFKLDIHYVQAFGKVDWESVHSSLWRVSRLFQIWVCKQVMGIAPANGNIPWDKTINPLCPSCSQVKETCLHILFCNHAGRVVALIKFIDILKHWLTKVDTDLELVWCTRGWVKNS